MFFDNESSGFSASSSVDGSFYLDGYFDTFSGELNEGVDECGREPHCITLIFSKPEFRPIKVIYAINELDAVGGRKVIPDIYLDGPHSGAIPKNSSEIFDENEQGNETQSINLRVYQHNFIAIR